MPIAFIPSCFLTFLERKKFMIRNNISWTIKNMKSMIDNPNKDTLNFNHPIQRKGGVWSIDAASSLIHSILMNSLYPIPSLYCLKEMNEKGKYTYSILDGKQRLTNIFSFIDSNFALTNIPIVLLDGEEYDLNGMFFSDLPKDCQMEILKYKFTIYSFEPEEDDDEELVNTLIEDIFFRLNSSVALSITDKCRALMGVENATFFNRLLNSKLFSECSKFTSLQLKKSEDLNTLLQATMLLDAKYNNYEYKNISQKEIAKYCESIHNGLSIELKQKIEWIVDYLEKVFPSQEKMLKKINLPIIFLTADVALGDYNPKNSKAFYRVAPNYFRKWFIDFFNEKSEEYSQYCSSGSTNLEKTTNRLNCMLNHFKQYFEIDEVNNDTLASEKDSKDEDASLDDTSMSEPKETTPSDEHENVSLTDSIMADMEQPHIPPDEENNEN